MEFILSYIHFTIAVIYAALSFFIIVKDPRSPLHLTCAGVLVCFFIWSSSMAVIHHPAVSLETAVFFEQTGSTGWIWFNLFFLWFAWLYVGKPYIRFFKFFTILVVTIPLILSVQQITNHALIIGHEQRTWGWFSVWSRSRWMFLFLIYYHSFIITGAVFLFSAMVKSDNVLFRRQSAIMLIGGLLSLTIGTIVNIIFPLFFPEHSIPTADITALFWALGLVYAVYRYQLLNITPFIAAGRIISVMNDLLFLLDLRGRIVSVNKAAVTILACPEEKLTGLDFDTLIADNGSQQHTILNLIRDTPSNSIETVLSFSKTVKIPVALSIALIKNSGIVCVAHDISLQKMRTESLREAKQELETEIARATLELQKTNVLLTQEVLNHKKAVRELRDSQERFRIIFENAPDGMYIAKCEGTLIEANREAFRISGLFKSEILGKTVNQLGLSLESASNPGSLPVNDAILRRKDGSSLPVELSVHQVKIGGEELSLGVIRDLSLRKKAEAEAEALKAELHQAQKMEAIGRLAGGIAHDFNNLLGGISGFAQLLYKQLETERPESAVMVKKILNAASQASGRIAQLLAFARKGHFRIETVNIQQTIEEVIGLLEHTIDKKIILNHCFMAEQPIVSGDRSQLHSALLNLAVNARDALPSGGEITFKTELVGITPDTVRNFGHAGQPGTFLKVTVQDNGIGMNDETRARIFEPFYTTKEQGKGTGLGLASVYGTVKHHNGCIEVESAPGRGTTITVYLPVSAMPAAITPDEPSFEKTGSDKGRILIVDDVELLREMMRETLNIVGYEAYECIDGRDAVEWYSRNCNICDLIILDISMPILSGRECFAALKKINPLVKVIITSGHSMDKEINDTLKDGAVAFLKKPFDSDELIATIRKNLD